MGNQYSTQDNLHISCSFRDCKEPAKWKIVSRQKIPQPDYLCHKDRDTSCSSCRNKWKQWDYKSNQNFIAYECDTHYKGQLSDRKTVNDVDNYHCYDVQIISLSDNLTN